MSYSVQTDAGRPLRPSERFANTGAFGESGIFGQGGTLTGRGNAIPALSPSGTPSSASSTSLATTAASSRNVSPPASKIAGALASTTELSFLDFDPSANKAFPLPAGAAPIRSDGDGPFSLSGSLTFKDTPAPRRRSDATSPNSRLQADSAPQTPSKKKFFSFGRNSSKKDYSSSALSDDEGPPLSEMPNKQRFSRFSRSFSTGTPSSSAGKRSKSAGPGPRPSIASQDSNSSIKQVVPSSSSSTLNDEWVLLQKRDPSPPKQRVEAGLLSSQTDLEKLAAASPPGRAIPNSTVPVQTPPPVKTASSRAQTPPVRSPVQQGKTLPTSPPFYPSQAAQRSERTSAAHPGLAVGASRSTEHVPTSTAQGKPADLFSPPLPPSKQTRRKSHGSERGRPDVAVVSSPKQRPPMPHRALDPAMSPPQRTRKRPDTSRKEDKLEQARAEKRASAVPPKPMPARSDASSRGPDEGSYPNRSGAALTAENLSKRSNAALPAVAAESAEETTCVGKPRFEEALLEHQHILINIIDYIDYPTFRNVCRTSSCLRKGLHKPSIIDLACERYIGSFGYRSMPPKAARKPNLDFSLRDLDAFHASMEYSLSEYAILAVDHKRSALPMPLQRKIRAATRAHSKLVLRLRAQSTLHDLQLSVGHWQNAGLQGSELYKRGRAPVLRVWVPTAGAWMTNSELEECEREVHRAGLWDHLQRGDLIRNVAVSDIANEGLVIFDGKYLRDLSFVHDRLGHLPSWLNGLAFSPSYFHNQIACTNGEPVIYLDLTPFLSEMQANITLCKEKTALTSPGGERYAVNRYVYRTACELVPGTILGDAGGKGGSGPGGIEALHPDWAGTLVIETEGTAEAARDLLERATSKKRDILPNQPRASASINNHPYKILRSLSRPGQIWIVPVFESVSKPGKRT